MNSTGHHRNYSSQEKRQFKHTPFPQPMRNTNHLFQTHYQKKYRIPNTKYILSNKNANNHTKPSKLTLQFVSEQPTQLSNTQLIKSYVQKLKRQHKKQQQEKVINREQKILNSSQLCKNNDSCCQKKLAILPLQKLANKNKVKFAQKFHTARVTSKLNTISFGSAEKKKGKKEDIDFLYGIQLKNLKEPEWANKQKIDELIKTIRNSRNRFCTLQQLSHQQQSDENSKQNKKTIINEGSKKKLSSLGKNKWRRNQKLGQNIRNFREVDGTCQKLEPWMQQSNAIDFSIQQYRPQF